MTQPEIDGQPVPDDESLAFEIAAVAAVTAAVAASVGAVLGLAFTAYAAGASGAALAAELASRLRRVRWAPMRPALRKVAADARDLGVRRAGPPYPPEVDEPDLPDPDRAVADALQNAARLAQLLPMTTKRDLQSVQGRANQGLATARGHARWVANEGINAGVAAVARARGERLIWVAERNACLHCLAHAGYAVEPGDPFPIVSYDPIRPDAMPAVLWPPLHPNCFPAGTIVSGPGVRATFARRYEGEMVEIRTASGRILAGTPNHPVLTDQGWVALGGIVEGTHVLTSGKLERMLARNPHDYQEPTRIEDVSGALRSAPGGTVVSVPVSAEDFHGDGTGGNVHVVWADGLLRGRTEVAQPFGHEQFSGAGSDLSRLPGLRTARYHLDRIAATLSGGMGGAGESGALNRIGVRHSGSHRGGPVTHLDAVGREPRGDRGSTDAEIVSKSLHALSGLVTPDQVIGVRRYPFAGHVYNLETSGGWYIGNGIVTHNCRCQVRTYTGPAGRPSADRSRPDPAARLAAEARRSVVYQWTDYASGVRARAAAGRLLDMGASLPDSVERRARRALRMDSRVKRPT